MEGDSELGKRNYGSLYTVWAISCKTAQKQGTQVWRISVIREVEIEGPQFLQPLALRYLTVFKALGLGI